MSPAPVGALPVTPGGEPCQEESPTSASASDSKILSVSLDFNDIYENQNLSHL